MPSKTASKPPADHSATADFEDYLLDGDLSDNPFGSPTPGASNNKSNKRKEPANALGIDEEVEVKKRATVPRVKLDEARLLSEPGIPTLRQRARRQLRLKGKGHEWSDAARLLSLYQIWLDDLFPKAKFLDALAMVEKAGHKGAMHKARLQWIEEGKPRDETNFGEDLSGERDGEEDGGARGEKSRIAPVFEMAKRSSGGRRATPEGGVPGDEEEDIYGATPRQKQKGAAQGGGEPDEEDDLDALMAEAESAPVGSIFGGGKPAGSLFGGPVTGTATATANEPDEEDLDALMAEAEAEAPTTKPPPAVGSIFGDGKPRTPAADEDDDLEALMAEVEAGEAGEASSKPLPAEAASKKPDVDGGSKAFADEEEAMAEMDGLW